MKKILLISLAFVLTACGVVQPVQQVPPTPVIATVLVTVIPPTEAAPPTAIPLPTQAPTLPPTEIPTQVPPTPTVVPPTEAVQPTATQAAAAQPTQGSTGPSTSPVAIDPSFNGDAFTNMTASTGIFYLRCAPKDIKFDVTTTNVYITTVEMYFRIRDKHSTYVPEWTWGGTLETDGGYHFWITINSEGVNPDLRKQQGWYDVEFVGLNKLGDVVGRTEKITDVFSFAVDCK